MSGASDNGGEDSTGSIVSCKASFAHTRAIVNHEGSDFLIHFCAKKKRNKEERIQSRVLQKKKKTVLTSGIHQRRAGPIVTHIGR